MQGPGRSLVKRPCDPPYRIYPIYPRPVARKQFRIPNSYRQKLLMGSDIRAVPELLGHKAIAMTVRYCHLAPKHTLAAVERLDASTETRPDTAADTGMLQRPAMQTAVLQ